MAQDRAGLYLVDGSGYIFRAFFALPQLNNSRGLPTNAVYGFVRMLVKLLKEAHPAYLTIVFDSPRKTFRDDLFEDYKANRAEAPNDLVAQIPYVHRAVEAFGIKRLMVEGYEADDVIGTLALRAARENFDVTIITADKDFMQLVGPRVTLWDTMRERRTGLREVRERFGVEPRALIDIMALTGDAVDNIKGVPGIGEKTAGALIRKFGSLDRLYQSLDRVEEAGVRGAKRVRELLESHRADAELARKLVRIETETPLRLDPDDLKWKGIDRGAAADLMRELDFGSLLAEIGPSDDSAREPAREQAVAGDSAAAALAELAAASHLALHLDSAPKTPRLKLSAHGGACYVLEGAAMRTAGALLGAAVPPKSCHDLKDHLRRFHKLGLELKGAEFDTMLAGFLINPGRAEPALADLYHEHLAPLGAARGPGSEPALVDALREALSVKLEQNRLVPLFRDIEMPIAGILAEMETAGVAVDAAALKELSAEFGAELKRLEDECFELAGRPFNLNSPVQLRELLFNQLKLSAKGIKKSKAGLSTDVDTLTRLAASHPLPRKILDYRAIAKLKSTYSDALPALIDPATGRIHTSFHQALTATGRLSSSDPNLQNIPARSKEGRRIRRAFVARPGALLLSADYSQIELRVLAHLSADPTLVEAFKRGEDIHVRTATEVLGLTPGQVDADARRLAKVINFGIIYGMGPQRLAGELGLALAEASNYIKRYFERLPGVQDWLDRTLREARRDGFVTTMYGRRRYLPELSSPQGGARAQAERIAVNTPIQGTAADLIKLAMIKLARVLSGVHQRARMLLQVHDELIFEVESEGESGCGYLKETCEMVRREMEEVAALKVPLQVELKMGPNWAELAGLP